MATCLHQRVRCTAVTNSANDVQLVNTTSPNAGGTVKFTYGGYHQCEVFRRHVEDRQIHKSFVLPEKRIDGFGRFHFTKEESNL